MKLSVACNFDDALLDGLAPYPVYEVYGKLTADPFGRVGGKQTATGFLLRAPRAPLP
ncbi:MAG: hypothetical protein GY898_16210 [Proteobacteria bacterium]|nr:hypothetical protein [Pseudomonadota bacterium]